MQILPRNVVAGEVEDFEILQIAELVWISLFTSSPIGSVMAWITGIISSAAGGFVSGWVFAYVYNRVLKA